MRITFILWAFIFTNSLFSQSLPNRYKEEVFASYQLTEQVLFSTDVPQPIPGGGFYEWLTGYPLNADEFNTTDINLYMDIYEPTGDTLTSRPVVIVCFGGGFLSGSKDHWSIQLLAQELAKRGFVVATIDYRLGMNIFDADLSQRAVYRALQDGRSAVRYFREDAANEDNYKIDPNQIFIGGHSSGGFIATHNAYLDKESERPLPTYAWTEDGTNYTSDLGCLDCAGDNQSYDGAANGIFSLAGAIGFTDLMESSADPTVVMFHSTDDGTVPYTNGQPFSDILWLVVGSELPDVYGSSDMADRADVVGIDYDFFSYTSRGHGVHENDPNLYSDIVPGITDWFVDDRLKPNAGVLIGDSIICNDGLEALYHTTEIPEGYYDWVVSGSSNIVGDYNDNLIQIDWDENALDTEVIVVPYSKNRARGDSLSMSITIYDHTVNIWQSTDGNWSEESNWSTIQIPNRCEDVILPPSESAYEILVEDLQEARSIEVGQNATLKMNAEAILEVYDSILGQQ